MLALASSLDLLFGRTGSRPMEVVRPVSEPDWDLLSVYIYVDSPLLETAYLALESDLVPHRILLETLGGMDLFPEQVDRVA